MLAFEMTDNALVPGEGGRGLWNRVDMAGERYLPETWKSRARTPYGRIVLRIIAVACVIFTLGFVFAVLLKVYRSWQANSPEAIEAFSMQGTWIYGQQGLYNLTWDYYQPKQLTYTEKGFGDKPFFLTTTLERSGAHEWEGGGVKLHLHPGAAAEEERTKDDSTISLSKHGSGSGEDLKDKTSLRMEYVNKHIMGTWFYHGSKEYTMTYQHDGHVQFHEKAGTFPSSVSGALNREEGWLRGPLVFANNGKTHGHIRFCNECWDPKKPHELTSSFVRLGQSSAFSVTAKRAQAQKEQGR